MNVKDAIKKRRSLRAYKKFDVEDSVIYDLFESASLAPSCFNNQPWRYVFVKSEKKLRELFSTLSKGNEWAFNSSLIIAVHSNKDYDCIVKNREYYLFDTGLSVSFLILRATELGLETHIIAGFDSERAKKILNIPEENNLIALIIVGKYSEEILKSFDDKLSELERPKRESFDVLARIV